MISKKKPSSALPPKPPTPRTVPSKPGMAGLPKSGSKDKKDTGSASGKQAKPGSDATKPRGKAKEAKPGSGPSMNPPFPPSRPRAIPPSPMVISKSTSKKKK